LATSQILLATGLKVGEKTFLSEQPLQEEIVAALLTAQSETLCVVNKSKAPQISAQYLVA
jgi:hypothetical protein